MSAWPSLRPILPALLALSLSHCSCQRQPDGPPPPDPGVSALARLPVATDDNLVRQACLASGGDAISTHGLRLLLEHEAKAFRRTHRGRLRME